MQLIKLEIKGFKSFGDKVTVNFNEGVTAIVGPNGCGKSNVVDAMRWVLGEQSTKNLRSDKMENIIFNGTKDRKPANLAEVSLTFDNTKNILPTEFATVTVTRKLFRNGDSEYRLNDVKCRLKDITDLFLDTGIGADTYSIIELKMIDELINNKDHSRRKLFEEASGISKYKVRKKQTLSKLKETEADLARVDDIVSEITKNLKSLESQAKKADRYFRLKDEYREHSISLTYYKLEDFQKELDLIQGQEATHRQQQQDAIAKASEKEEQLKSLKEEILIQEKNLAKQQRETQEFITKIRNYESEKRIKNTQLQHLRERETRLQQDLQQDKAQAEHLSYQIKMLNEDVFQQTQILDNQSSEMQTAKVEIEERYQQQRSAKEKLEAFNRQQQALLNQRHALEKELAVLAIQKDSLEQELQRIENDITSKQSESIASGSRLEELQAKLLNQQNELDALLHQETELQAQIEHRETRIAEQKNELQSMERLLDARQNEYNLTKSMVDNLEGFPESIRFLKKHAGWKKTPPLLSDILFCPQEYRIAIENYLEPVMNHYVVSSQQEAIHAIQLLNDSSQGRAKFFILDAIDALPPSPPSATTLEEELVPALDVIQIDDRYKKLAAHLLHHVYLSSSDEPYTLAHTLPQDQRVILHSEGHFAMDRYSLSGGSVGLFEGKRIGRAKNLEQLALEIKQLNKDHKVQQDQLDDETRNVAELRAQTHQALIDEKRIQVNALQHELGNLEAQQQQYVSMIDNNKTRKITVEANLEAVRQQLDQTQPQLHTLQQQTNLNQDEAVKLEEDYAAISDLYTEQSDLFNRNNLQFHQQQNKVASLTRDLEFRESQKELLEQRIEKFSEEFSEVNIQLKNALQHIDENDTDLSGMYQEKSALEKGLSEKEDEFYRARKAIQDVEEQWSTLRKSKELTDQLIEEFRERKMTLQIDLNSLKDRLSVEFDIELETLLEADVPKSDLTQAELESLCKKLKKQLDEYGSINPTAKEAFEEINQRHKFIQKEKTDLLDAKDVLLRTIAEIDQSANDKFMSAYNTVRGNFVRVFRSLFNEEDACDLVLSNPDNPLESDVDIIASPKGKRPLSINQLSGGEKTLTATALLFSLYLLKPAPFCIFDEVDAPLDDTNIDKFNNIIREFSEQSQFIIVSHNKRTIASTDIIYGVTMVEQGVSKLVAVDLRDVA